MIIVAFSGSVGAGKSSVASLVESYVSLHHNPYTFTLPIAYALKKELQPIVWNKYGVSSFSEERADKVLFRDDLIRHAEEQRNKDPYYWINQWQKRADELSNECLFASAEYPPLFIIPDLRHADTDNGDIDMDVLHEEGALTIHVEQYKDEHCTEYAVFPYGESEERNDPFLKSKSFFNYRWRKCVNYKEAWLNSPDTKNLLSLIDSHIKKNIPNNE